MINTRIESNQANQPKPTSTDRQCGDCAACCEAMNIPALGKPAGVRCVHLISPSIEGKLAHHGPQSNHAEASQNTPCKSGDEAGRCSQYGCRPEVCQGFVCLWLRDKQNLFAAEDRPDQLGLIFNARTAGSSDSGQPRLVAQEVWAGASTSLASLKVIQRLSQFVEVSVVTMQEVDVHVVTTRNRGRAIGA